MWNVLLVDDEPLILAGLKKKVDWQALGFCVAATAGDSDSALRRARSVRPDLVLLDVRIPTVNGLELMRHIQAEIPCYFIVVSGFSDFEYARQALQLGALDYLLKPVSAGALQSALLAAREALLARAVPRPAFFRTLEMLQTQGGDGDARFLREWSLEKQDSAWACAYGPLQKLRLPAAAGLTARCLFQDGGNGCWLFNFAREQELLRALEQAAVPPLGLSSSFFRLAELPEAIRKAEDCFDCRLYDSESRVITACVDDFSPLAGLLSQIRNAHRKKLLPACAQLVQKAPAVMAARHLSFRCCERFYGAVQALAYQNEVPAEARFSREELLALGAGQAADRLAALFLDTAPAQARVNGKQIVEKIRACVDENWGGEFSLGEFAEQYYLDKNYLSHIFKEAVGENFSAYVNRVRLEHACNMLRETQLRTEAVAALCGYRDFSYFAKVFKKHVGVTPTQYREAGGTKK